MDPQSSSTAAIDPDRINIQYFEKGGANPQREPIVVVNSYFYVQVNSFSHTFL